MAVIDVRAPAEFAAAHVPGACNLPLDAPDFEPKLQAAAGSGGPIFLICQSGARSRLCGNRLAAAGWDVASVDGGTAAWIRAGYPVNSLPGARTVISLERQVRIGAGAIIVTGCGLGWWVHPVFFGLSALVGAGLIFAGVTDFCGLGLLLARMPWNRG